MARAHRRPRIGGKALTFLLLALARSTVPLLLAIAATSLHIPAILRRRIVRAGLVLSLLAALSAFVTPTGPPVSRIVNLPPIPILQPGGAATNGGAPLPDLSAASTAYLPVADPISLYGLFALVGALPLTLGAIRLRGILRAARRSEDAAAYAELDDAAYRIGIRPPGLRVSGRVKSPFVAGLFRPEIVLPELNAEGANLRAILSHEAAHIRNHDIAWRLFHRLLCLLLWPQPLVWLLLRPARAIEEEACDQDALLGGIRPSDYARTLLSVAEGPLPSAAVGMRTPGASLTRRIAALLQPPTMKPKKRFLFVSFTVTAFIFAAGLAACLAASPQDPDEDNLPMPQGDLQLTVVGADGKPVIPTAAYLVTYGDTLEKPPVPLRTSLGRIHYTLDQANPRGASTIVAVAKGSALGFHRVWPPAEGAPTLKLPSAAQKTVTLKTPDGKPAANLSVSPVLLVGSGDFNFLTLTPKLAATFATKTDENGVATFTNLSDLTRIAFDTEDARFASLGADLKAGEKGVEVTLIPAAEISGIVTRNGKPVSGVKVGAQDNHNMPPSNRLGVWADTITDADGRYRLRRLPPSIVNVALFSNTVPGKDATAPAHESVTLKEGSVVSNLHFKLTPGAIITGIVYGMDGKPKAGTDVGVYGPAHPNSSAWVDSARTDKNGRYTIHVPAGKQRVYPMDSRYEQDAETFTLVEGQIQEQNFRLRPAGSILNALRRN
ncbi:hypothetical protein EON81_11465 [bacterium]|nr:MAG: hypothetical protein EON81_11465 [bacterium]